MPPIQVFSNSPINAAKPSGTTPQTANSDGQNSNEPPPATTTKAYAPPSSQQQSGYPAAQPGARPSLPVPTGIASIQPTPTQSTRSSSPPAPQPGAVPAPPGSSSHLPPPPRAGETLRQQSSHVVTAPPQMSYTLSGSHAPTHAGSSTTTAPDPSGYQRPGPTSLAEAGGPGSNYGQFAAPNPQGYQQQGSYASGQRSYREDDDYDNQDESVWGTAKKWAAAAGESLANAESEVWKRINKD